jgi:transketolase
MGKADLGDVHESELPTLGDQPIPIVQIKSKNAIYATGSMVKPCFEIIQKKLVDADLFSVPVIKKGGLALHKQSVQNYSKIVTVEEHSIYGGLGDVFSEAVAELGTVKLKRLGVSDRFSEKCGTYQYLMREHGLDVESLTRKLNQWF